MEKQYLVLIAGFWHPSIMYLQAGPKVTTISMVQADDEKAIQRLMTGAIALLERWPVFEIEMVANLTNGLHVAAGFGHVRRGF